MSNVLESICTQKRAHVRERMTACPISTLSNLIKKQSKPRGFAAALAKASEVGYGLIAEIKKLSPSKGLLRKNFNPTHLAQSYQLGGATCISILTDTPYFGGKDEDLVAVRKLVSLPILRKDFILEPYQVIESRALGADCILLIMAALRDAEARKMEEIAFLNGMDVLLEVHNEAELERALLLKSPLIGINNRNLISLKTNTHTTRRLAKLVPKTKILISESGLYTPNDLSEMAKAGARCFLIGEALMRKENVTLFIKELLLDPFPVKTELENSL